MNFREDYISFMMYRVASRWQKMDFKWLMEKLPQCRMFSIFLEFYIMFFYTKIPTKIKKHRDE